MADVTYKQVIDLVQSLPADRLSSIYDFARFLKEHPVAQNEAVDLFGETPEEIEADEKWWGEQFKGSESDLLRLAENAVDEYQAGTTTSMDFDEQGRLKR